MTLPFLGHLDLGDASYPLTVIGIVAVMNIVNFIDGVDGLAAGVCTIAAGTFAVIALSLDRNEAGRARDADRRSGARVPAPRVPPGVDLPRRLGLEPARLHAGRDRRPGRPEDERGGGARLPARDPGRADPRFELRDRQAHQVRSARVQGRPLALPPPLREHRLLAAAHRPIPVRMDARARDAGAGAAVRPLLGRPRQLRRRLEPRDRAGSSSPPRRRASTWCWCSRS